MASSILEAWAIVGDFNSYTSDSEDEKSGGAEVNHRTMNRFRDVIQGCGFIDLGFLGPPFTWEWNGVKERLDRGLYNVEWSIRFLEVVVHHLPSFSSDHKPRLLTTQRSTVPSYSKTFKFMDSWLEDPSFKDLVVEAWSNGHS
ncbi:Endonuclease/exonuclease/phosphatase superfamily [Sesbania bispinosa]|nr:Endonuclease/exonuclease/phosphatase superfamily [Sesbania bispinosa]